MVMKGTHKMKVFISGQIMNLQIVNKTMWTDRTSIIDTQRNGELIEDNNGNVYDVHQTTTDKRLVLVEVQ